MRSLLVVFAVAACGCDDSDKAPAPARSAPWRATPSASAESAGFPVDYGVAEDGRVSFELPAKDATPRGRFRVTRGQLKVNLTDLARTRGTVEVDVATVQMDPESDAGPGRESETARNWLNVGQDRPQAERERRRWAKLTIKEISRVSAEAAHEGKRVATPPPPDGGEDAGVDAGARPSEIRKVTLTAVSEVELNGFRVTRPVSLVAFFEYGEPAATGAEPERIRIETAKPFRVSLEAYEIQPRTSAGVLIAEQLPWIGKRVGREAKVSVQLSATPARQRPEPSARRPNPEASAK